MHMLIAQLSLPRIIFFLFLFVLVKNAPAQQPNLLLNGGFEDINNCAEYHSECGVEAWFYMNAIQVQLQHAEKDKALLGNTTLTVFYNWTSYEGFYPVIGTLLPCKLQKGKRYTLQGLFSARLNSKLLLKPGVAMGEKFYVPQRPFSQGIVADSIPEIHEVANTGYFSFKYLFTATGNERYLTFGTFISENLTNGKRFLTGKRETVSLTVDNFELLANDQNEVVCGDFEDNKHNIYLYDFRHKNMDYGLYGKGELPIPLSNRDSGSITRTYTPPSAPAPVMPVPSDTILLGDVLFDFNQSSLKPTALQLLDKIFRQPKMATIDSIYVEGHTDAIGTETQNLALSRQRSQNVGDWLLQRAILPDGKIQIHAFGKSRPIATNNTAQGRATNRRVELIIFRHVP